MQCLGIADECLPAAVLWSAQQGQEPALAVAYSRISMIVLAVLIMALLGILINPAIASEQACMPC